MNTLSFLKISFSVILAVTFYQNVISIPIKCGLEANCTITKNSQVCILDDAENCIRKYPSKCHLDIAACKQGKNITDYSEDYCAMDTYFCEIGYERWTIFFGHEK